MKKDNKKRTLQRLSPISVLLISLAVVLMLNTSLRLYNKKQLYKIDKKIMLLSDDIKELKLDQTNERALLGVLMEERAREFEEQFDFDNREIIVTNYWTNDGSSGDTIASGLTTKDFEVNEDGMYTYQGNIVIATANIDRLSRPLKEGYKSYSLYDTLMITVEGKPYTGVVLDVCGACYGMDGESNQRYDIFTVDNVIGKVKGLIYE